MSVAIRKAIDEALDKLEPDAVLAVAWLADRLLMGQRYYGKIDIATDPRDWVTERRDEIGDLLVYSAFEELKRSLAEAAKNRPPLDDVAPADALPVKCSWASCQKFASRGRFCEPHAKQADDEALARFALGSEAPTRSTVSIRGPVTFGCECVPRELRSEKGLRCATCSTLVRIG
jgi:hypothetical protein